MSQKLPEERTPRITPVADSRLLGLSSRIQLCGALQH